VRGSSNVGTCGKKRGGGSVAMLIVSCVGAEKEFGKTWELFVNRKRGGGSAVTLKFTLSWTKKVGKPGATKKRRILGLGGVLGEPDESGHVAKRTVVAPQ